MSVRILAVDDNPDILSNVRDYLAMKDGWLVNTALNGSETLRKLSEDTYQLLILDIGLPDIDGIAITKHLRESGANIPILMLTARDTVDDRVDGLTSGADDYLVKPFSLRELAARVEALLRRAHGGEAETLAAGDLVFNLRTMRVTRAGTEIRLNPTCMQLLRELLQRSPGIVGRARLENLLWNGAPPTSDSLRSNLYLLRQAVDKPFEKPLIHTHPGLGWSVSGD